MLGTVITAPYAMDKLENYPRCGETKNLRRMAIQKNVPGIVKKGNHSRNEEMVNQAREDGTENHIWDGEAGNHPSDYEIRDNAGYSETAHYIREDETGYLPRAGDTGDHPRDDQMVKH